MASQSKILEKIQTTQHGHERPFKAVLLKDCKRVIEQGFATPMLAWAAGENWKALNKAHDYSLSESSG